MRVGISGTFWHQEHTGSGQYIRHLLPELCDLAPGDEHLPISPTYTQRSDAHNSSSQHLSTTPFDRMHENLAKVWFEQVSFPRACRELCADIAHVPYFAPPLRSSVPVVVTIHDLIPLILPDYRGSAAVQAYMRLVSRAARSAALVLTDSQASASDIRRLLHIPEDRLRVIPLAADDDYHPLSSQEQRVVLDRLGVPDRYLFFLGGSFDERKNVASLLRAYARAVPDLDGVRLVVAGRLPKRHTPFTPDPRVVARTLGLEGSIVYTGWVDEVDKPALYAGAVAFVYPSQYEGFGLPVLESISGGTPAIVGSGSSLEEVAGAGGIAVDPGDVDSLAAAMVTVVQDSNRRQDLSSGGLDHAQEFSWRETARLTSDAYHEALAGA